MAEHPSSVAAFRQILGLPPLFAMKLDAGCFRCQLDLAAFSLRPLKDPPARLVFLAMPKIGRHGFSQLPSRSNRRRAPQRVKHPNRLRRLAPQPHFVSAHASAWVEFDNGQATKGFGDFLCTRSVAGR